MFCCCAGMYAQTTFVDTSKVVSKLPVADTGSLISPSPRPFVIDSIVIDGIKKTKSYIVLRELPFHSGDSIYLPELVKAFETARRQLYNTSLFVSVVVALKAFRGHAVDVLIEVRERWYIFPLPYFRPIDRNLTEWGNRGYALNRVNYGFKLTHNNFTGRNDKLKVWLITGYTHQVQFQYEQPYVDKSLKHGYKVGFIYAYNKEINYNTTDNKQAFTDTLERGVKRISGNVDYTYRPGLRTFHDVRLSVTRLQVDSQVLALNPQYLNNSHSTIVYPELSYTLSYFNVDYNYFPLTGWMGEAGFLKKGISSDMNMWQITGKLTKGWQLLRKTYFGTQWYGTLRFPFDQPFINQRLFGYGDLYMRGLERYVIDGVAAYMAKNSLRRELVRFDLPTHLKSNTYATIPFRIYARAFGDLGYVYNKNITQNSLTNRWLYTGGVGIDIVSIYDCIFRFDYSFNQLGQKGIFLHIKNDF
ncbi:MAG: hypothetical protein QM731_18490 [Chitinophagaceae bacterium]